MDRFWLILAFTEGVIVTLLSLAMMRMVGA